MFGDRIQEILGINEVISADATRAMGRMNGAAIVQSADVFNGSALATHATNYVTFKIINLGTDGSGTTVIASASTSQTGGSAMVANQAFPLTIVAAAQAVADGEAIGFVYDEATTDVANNHPITATVKFTRVGAPS